MARHRRLVRRLTFVDLQVCAGPDTEPRLHTLTRLGACLGIRGLRRAVAAADAAAVIAEEARAA